MAYTVDKCDNYENPKCKKCGRTLPDLCKDQEELEMKAAAYDRMQRDQRMDNVMDVVEGLHGDTLNALAGEATAAKETPKEPLATKVARAKQKLTTELPKGSEETPESEEA